jgi:hypothetical protein
MVFLLEGAWQVHLRAPWIDQQLAATVVQVKGNVERFLYDFSPKRVMPAPSQLPGDCTVVVALGPVQR